jgi:hypothetical protein
MGTYTFNCPACGAAVDYKGGSETTIRCLFCNSDVVVPQEVRSGIPLDPKEGSHSRGSAWGMILVVVIGLIFSGVAFAIFSANRAEKIRNPSAANVVSSTIVPPTQVISPTSKSTLAFAVPGLSFGEKGIGPGQLNDARYLAVDGSGRLYLADYSDDRVQVFDSSGKYLNQFSVGDGQTTIHGMTADRQGHVFISLGHTPDILEYNGETGQLLGKFSNPDGGEFGMLATTASGNLAAAWYESRWGFINSLEGHRDDLLLFDDEGKITLTIPSFISAQTGDFALDNYIAVDGLGKVFALSEGVVYVFSPQGKYTDKFDGTGGKTMQYSNPGSITVDGQDRVYIGDTSVVHVYSEDGSLIADFPIRAWVNSMVVDEQGNLWLLGGDKITKYTLSGK